MSAQTNAALTIAEEFQLRIRFENKKNKIIQFAPAIILVVLAMAFSVLSSDFLTVANFRTILNQVGTPLILAIGVTFVIMMGSIDLSVEGIMGLSGSLVSVLVLNNKNFLNLGMFGIVIALAIGTLTGFLTGFIHVKARIPSFMVSFGISSIASGFALLSYGAVPPTIADPIFAAIAGESLFGIPMITCISLVVLAGAYFLQEKTAFGRYVYGIGESESILRSCGINVDKVKMLVFALSGFCISLAGIIGAARLMRGDSSIGIGYQFPAITAVVVGGTSLSGGKGGVMNTLVGALIVTVLQNGLLLMGVNPYIQQAIQGIIIVTAVALSIARGGKIIIK